MKPSDRFKQAIEIGKIIVPDKVDEILDATKQTVEAVSKVLPKKGKVRGKAKGEIGVEKK